MADSKVADEHQRFEHQRTAMSLEALSLEIADHFYVSKQWDSEVVETYVALDMRAFYDFYPTARTRAEHLARLQRQLRNNAGVTLEALNTSVDLDVGARKAKVWMLLVARGARGRLVRHEWILKFGWRKRQGKWQMESQRSYRGAGIMDGYNAGPPGIPQPPFSMQKSAEALAALSVG